MTQNLTNTFLVPDGIPVFNPAGDSLTSLVLEDGELLIGALGNPIAAALISAGANVTITPGAGTLEISSVGGGGGTITGVVLTRRNFTGTLVFSANMVACHIEAFGRGGSTPGVNPQLTGAGAPYPINYITASSGTDGGTYLRMFGTAAQLGGEVVIAGGDGPAASTGIDPDLLAQLSVPPDQTAYNNRAGVTLTLTFATGVVATLPGGDGARYLFGATSTDAAEIPFISPDGLVASKRWGNTTLPTCTDPTLILVAGAQAAGYPGIAAGTGTGASDPRALAGGIGGGCGPIMSGGRSVGVTDGTDFGDRKSLSRGTGSSGPSTGDLTRTAALGASAGVVFSVSITEYIE